MGAETQASVHLAVFFTVLLPACLSPATPSSAPEGARALSPVELSRFRTVVHSADGLLLSSDRFAGDLPSVEQRMVGNVYSWEPTIGVGPDGTAYYRSSDRIASPPRGYVYASEDRGKTWKDVSPRLAGVVPLPLFTGDPFLHVDPETGRVWAYDQQSFLVCDHWAYSDDKGKSWRTWDTCQEEASYGDHPAITTGKPRVSNPTGYPNVVYFCAAIQGTQCRVSLDGGRTFGPGATAIEACRDKEGRAGPEQHGHVRTGADGRVYLAKAACNAVLLGVSSDDGRTWQTIRVNESGWTHQRWPEYNEHEANVAVDGLGNIYIAVLGDDGLPKLVVSRDGGATWTKPVTVSRPDVTAANFVHIVAGVEGRIAVLFVGTTLPGGFNASPQAMSGATWNAYVSFSLDAHKEGPVFATAMVNPPEDPLRRGPCEGRCPVRPGPLGRGILQDGMYDFLDIDIDPKTGHVFVALVDLCHDACSRGTGSSEDGAYARAAVGVQVAGVGLLRKVSS